MFDHRPSPSCIIVFCSRSKFWSFYGARADAALLTAEAFQEHTCKPLEFRQPSRRKPSFPSFYSSVVLNTPCFAPSLDSQCLLFINLQLSSRVHVQHDGATQMCACSGVTQSREHTSIRNSKVTLESSLSSVSASRNYKGRGYFFGVAKSRQYSPKSPYNRAQVS